MIPKFRAWDREDKVMREVSGIHWGINVIEFYDEELDSGTYDLGDYDVMPYIGTTDINGKEIYAGDEVRKEECSPDDPAFGFYGSSGVVRYDDTICGFVVDGDGCFRDTVRTNFSFNELEVIGNICENTEMM